MRPRSPRLFAGSALVLVGPVIHLLLVASSTPALTFDINFAPGMPANAREGFTTGLQQLGALLADDITVRIDAKYAPLPGNFVGQSATPAPATHYSDVKRALMNDIKSSSDATAVANLQAGTIVNPQRITWNYGVWIEALKFFVHDEFTDQLMIDDETVLDSYNNTQMLFPRANMKAIGLTKDYRGDPTFDASTVDGTITIDSGLAWDFDRSNGIDSNRRDFIGVVQHEALHVLGFVSGVDRHDSRSVPNGPERPSQRVGDEQLEAWVQIFANNTVLDLFRFTEFSTTSAEGGIGIQDLGYGQRSATDIPYFSIDGGVTLLSQFTTGQFHGDGETAGHWKQGPIGQTIGIMTPDTRLGELRALTELDLLMLDVIGYDLVSSETLAGDFNEDGMVDARDYVIWRDGLGTKYSQADYTDWRANFGKMLPMGASTAQETVPEPFSLALLSTLSVVLIDMRRVT
jgi:hypothetical protein